MKLSKHTPPAADPIAVVGVSALFPGSGNSHGFWRDILAGRDLITDVPASRWLIEDHYDPDPRAKDKTYCKRGAFLDDIEFDAMEFGVPPSAIAATDTSQLLALIVAKRVLEDALGAQFNEVDRSRASVILGVTSGQELICEAASRLQRPVWLKSLRESGIPEEQAVEICERIAESYTPWQENTFPGLLGNVVAGRIANRFDLGGANFVTDAACASSLSALSVACGELHLGNSDLVIAGGVDTFNDIPMFVCFSKTPALSPTGDCRPFADNADGTILGEGLGMVALKRLSDAERDGNRIYAVIRSVGSGSDGRSKSIYAPLPEGQARALRRAYELAGYGPESVELVEAHGTATAAGDMAEFTALKAVFEASGEGRKQWCALGSVKSQIGHTKAAAGAAGLFKTVMALHHKVLPPTLKAERPNPEMDLPNSPFYLSSKTRPWIRGDDHPRRASLSSFGFGGTNFHIALEEYAGSGTRPSLQWTMPSELVLLAANSVQSLVASANRLADTCSGRALASIALDSQMSYDTTMPQRLGVVCENTGDLVRELRAFATAITAGEIRLPRGVYYGSAAEASGRVAFLFPGQASQYAGMTADLAMAWHVAREVWDRNADLASLVFSPPAASDAEAGQQKAALTATQNAQPAIAAASAAILATLGCVGLRPDGVAGHSFGEITALYAAGAYDGKTMGAIARRRGELLSCAATAPAGMISVRMETVGLAALLEQWGLDLAIANYNGPRQNVLSGLETELREAEQKLAALNIPSVRLQVSTAFHSPLMQPAREEFAAFLNTCEVSSARVAFYSNLTGRRADGSAAATRDSLAKLISAPVLFGQTIQSMFADGYRTFVEVGPSCVLTSLVGSILEGQPHRAIACDRAGANGVTSLWHALAQLAVSGLSMDFEGLRKGYEVPREETSGANRFTIAINGGNHARPYPPKGGASALPKPVAKQAAPVPAAAASDALDAYRVFQESITHAHALWQENLANGHREVVDALQNAYFATLGKEAPVLPALRITPQLPATPAVVFETVPRAPAPAPEVVVTRAASDARATLWAVVAEKTGYPEEMLEPSMALEADLGIDSIKRVEIFSAMQDTYAPMAEFDQAALTDLRTLADIVRWIESLSGEVEKPAAVAPAPAAAREIVLGLIAEKTGYPEEMLEPFMALEADLGIDSIKRVEIFSALQDAHPEASDVDQATLIDLRTVGDIIQWLDSFSAAPVKKTAPSDVRHVVRSVTAPATGHNMLDHGEGVIAIVGNAAVGEALAAVLQNNGYATASVVDVPANCRAVIAIEGMRRSSTAEESLELHRSVFLAAKAVAPMLREHGGLFVTVQDTGGEFAPGDAGLALGGGVAAIARTAAAEWPRARVKAIDIATSGRSIEEIVSAVAQELMAGGTEIDIGLTSSVGRITLAAVSQPATSSPLEIRNDAFVVATGGARGVTATSLIALAREKRLRILMLGRTASEAEPAFCAGAVTEAELKRVFMEDARARNAAIEPAALNARAGEVLASREIRNNLETIREAGSQVRYMSLDVRDAAAVASAIAEARNEWGPVAGVVHGAGVLADKLIDDLSPEQFDFVFTTKVAGLCALLAATENDPLTFIAMFSSIAARYGNAGQAAYAAGNEVLNRMAHAESFRRKGTAKVKALNWGPWDGGMVTPALRRQFEQRGVRPIPEEEGGRLFVDELAANDIEVVLGGAPAVGKAALRVLVSQRTFPVLVDHRIQGVPVFPVVGALDLFLRAAGMAGSSTCTGLKVLKGIRLDRFTNGGNLLTVREGADGLAEIVGPDGVKHYEATLSKTAIDAHDSWKPLPMEALNPSPWTLEEIYDGLLFHGPAFHAVRELHGISERGIRATLAGGASLGWSEPGMYSDSAMLDGGLQLARLWGYHKLNRPSLPTAIGDVRIFRPVEDRQTALCEVHANMESASRFVCDIRWTLKSGETLATMQGVEMHVLGDSNG